MKVCTKCLEPKILEDFYNSKKSADGKQWECIKCCRARKQAWAEINNQKIRDYAKDWRDKNPEQHKNSLQKWRKENKSLVESHRINRRLAEKQAKVVWANKDLMELVYIEAENLTLSTGIRHVVDHIHPLSSRLICGLHVETNLQVLTQHDNLIKNNKFTPYVESEE